MSNHSSSPAASAASASRPKFTGGARVQGIVLRLAVAAAATAVVGVAVERTASAEEVVIRARPPADRVEVRTRAPSPHHTWAPGYWGYDSHRASHVWYGGRWVEPRHGYTWEPAHWSERGGYWHLTEGHYRRL